MQYGMLSKKRYDIIIITMLLWISAFSSETFLLSCDDDEAVAIDDDGN